MRVSKTYRSIRIQLASLLCELAALKKPEGAREERDATRTVQKRVAGIKGLRDFPLYSVRGARAGHPVKSDVSDG